jgi:hypothetical protein
LNEKLKEELKRIKHIYENILKNIYGAAEHALGKQEERKNNKLW